jgi:hypothetical protein
MSVTLGYRMLVVAAAVVCALFLVADLANKNRPVVL